MSEINWLVINYQDKWSIFCSLFEVILKTEQKFILTKVHLPMSWSEFNSGNCYLMRQSIDNVSLQLWRHINNKKRALNKMPCGKKENCSSWCPIRVYSFVMNWLLDPEPCYIFINLIFNIQNTQSKSVLKWICYCFVSFFLNFDSFKN